MNKLICLQYCVSNIRASCNITVSTTAKKFMLLQGDIPSIMISSAETFTHLFDPESKPASSLEAADITNTEKIKRLLLGKILLYYL